MRAPKCEYWPWVETFLSASQDSAITVHANVLARNIHDVGYMYCMAITVDNACWWKRLKCPNVRIAIQTVLLLQ